MLRHLHKGKLACAATFQADWFAYVLWGIYECINTFFAMRLNEMDLQEGARLTNPMAALYQELLNCPPFYHMGCPAVLLACPKIPPANIPDTTTQQQRDSTKQAASNTQCKHGQGGYGTKKPHLQQYPEAQQHGNENYWNENKKYDATLKQTKQAILQHQCTNLGQVLRANGMTHLRHSKNSTSPPHCAADTQCGGMLGSNVLPAPRGDSSHAKPHPAHKNIPHRRRKKTIQPSSATSMNTPHGTPCMSTPPLDRARIPQ